MTTDQPILKRKTVIQLNDEFRSSPGADWFITDGVQTMGPEFVAQAVAAVASYGTFTADNDPFGEHDFGVMTIDGHKVFWKIDYYDLDLRYGSPDPRTPSAHGGCSRSCCRGSTDRCPVACLGQPAVRAAAHHARSPASRWLRLARQW